MVSKLRVIFLLSTGLVFGQIHAIAQRGDTVYENLFTNSTTIAPSANVTNIGQIGHQIVITYSNAPGHTCVAPQITTTIGSFQFSYDNVTWTNFGYQVSASSALLSPAIFFGTGAFPFVRFNLVSFDNTNCAVTVSYSGTLNNTTTAVQGGTIEGTEVNYYYPNVIGGFSGDGISGSPHLYNNSVTMPLCQNSLFGTGSVGGPSPLGTAFVLPAGVSVKIHVCSITVTSSGSGTVGFSFGNGTLWYNSSYI